MILTILGAGLLLLGAWWLFQAYRASAEPAAEAGWDRGHVWRKAFARAAPAMAVGTVLILLARR